ncbi:MAG: hypothetical protein P8Y58_01130, partial [Novosphingobium sp.]
MAHLSALWRCAAFFSSLCRKGAHRVDPVRVDIGALIAFEDGLSQGGRVLQGIEPPAPPRGAPHRRGACG